MKHTRGPWKVLDHDEDHITITDAEQSYGICILNEGSSESRSAMVANAHLIAALPDMLVALERARVFFTAVQESQMPSGLMVQIEQAIGKARGES